MRPWMVTLSALSLFVFGLCLYASAETPSQKIGAINMQKVVRTSASGQKALESLNKKFEGLKGKIDAKQSEVEAFKEDLDKKAPLLSEVARAEKDREYQKLLRDFKAEREDAQFEMQQAESEAMEPILKELEHIVTRIGEERGYSLILERNMPGLYYVASSIDITDEVITACDAASAKDQKKSK